MREPGRRTYRTGDIWQASYCAVMGVKLLWVEAQGGRRNTWVFDNEDDVAFQMGREYRTADVGVVPVLPFKDAYCRMAREAAAVRRERDNANDYANR